MLDLIPAYSRSYTGEDNLLKDWNANKDFKIPGGPYTSKQDLIRLQSDPKYRTDEVRIFWTYSEFLAAVRGNVSKHTTVKI